LRCIIVGAGKIGFSIAATLSKNKHDVIVIDISEERLRLVSEDLDVQTIEGSGAHPFVLKQAGCEKTDLLVAVTDKDELNMISCYMGKTYGVSNAVARIREPGYESFDDKGKELGIDLSVNPERVSAEEIYKLLLFPEARNVKYYADGQVQMLELLLTDKAAVTGKFIKDIEFPCPCNIVAIVRGGDEVIVPRGHSILQKNDIIFVLTATKDMASAEDFLGIAKPKKSYSVGIFGGGLAGYYLASLLENDGRFNVKLIESDAQRCEELSELLPHTMILNGSLTDIKLMSDENIGDMDACIAVTKDDKENVLVSILAKQTGAKKTIAQIRRSDYAPMIEKVGIDRAISPRNLTVAAILSFISRGKLSSVTFLPDHRLQVSEINIPADSAAKGKKLKDLHFPQAAIIGVIFRSGQIIVPDGDTELDAGDRVVVMASSEIISSAEKYLMKK